MPRLSVSCPLHAEQMRTFLVILLVIAAMVGGIAAYLVLTTPDEGTPVRFPLSASQRSLLARVPASAESFALIPTAALLHRKLRANPVTRDAVDRWTSEHDVPAPFMIGGGDAVIWRRDKKVSYAIRLDAFRAFLVRFWLTSTDVSGVWDGSVFVIGESGNAMNSAELDALLATTNGLPEADLLVVQREGARGAFPPLGRPALTAIRVTPREIVLLSRARAASRSSSEPRSVLGRHPRGALLSAAFAEPPRILGEVDRLLDAKLSVLAGNGGSIALYDVDTGTVFPRPKGVVSLHADEHTRALMHEVIGVAEIVGETRDTGSEILVSFDRESVPLYLKDAFTPAPWAANRWSLRLDPRRFGPILERLGDNRALRLIAPRIHRAARDLRRWTGALQQAESIEAADSESDGIEELRVRIASK